MYRHLWKKALQQHGERGRYTSSIAKRIRKLNVLFTGKAKKPMKKKSGHPKYRSF